MFYSIAIDGPAGSGKSSVAKKVAEQLNFDYVSSGWFYRAIALYMIENRIILNTPGIFSENFFSKINLSWDGSDIFLNTINVSNKINDSKVSQLASAIAVNESVRNFVNVNIRDLVNLRSVVIDGRDIGTIVLPNASVKIFLDADVRTRAIRRNNQQREGGHTTTLDVVVNELIERDNRDYTREIAPLAKATDAYLLDSSLLTQEETVEQVKRIYMEKIIGEHWN